MANVTYRLPDGSERTLEVAPGTSLMQAAVGAGIRGIVAECGGQLMCATCHVYIDHGADTLPDQGDDEGNMLELAASPVHENSRLSCQLVVGTDTAEVTVTIPEKQI